MSAPFDLAIIGSGFAGSLLAMIARRLGCSVLMLESSRHPRFAIGESSTPLANLLLEQIARDHDLPQLASLCKWGAWQREHSELGVGLKRGFSFFHHQPGAPFAASPDRNDQLLVAASPHDAIADTHWYRPDLDHYLVREAQALGVDYHDQIHLDGIEEGDDAIHLLAMQDSRRLRFSARFVVDASGPHGFLHRSLPLKETCSTHLPRRVAFFTHFRDVARLADLPIDCSGATPPFPVDEAAVHHVFDGGWIWVLHFNNGLTSAGAAVTQARAAEWGLGEGAGAWRKLLARLPTVAEQFAGAQPHCDFRHTGNLGFRSAACAGERWALLPSAAGFVDPLLSSGFPLTLLGVTRLARALEHDWNTPRFARSLRRYEQRTLEELIATERLVGALYASMGDFDLFASLARLYFAAASFSETAIRLGEPLRAGGYLMHDHAVFGPQLRLICDQVHAGFDAAGRDALMRRIDDAVDPIDVAGLGDRSKRNWHAADAQDLLGAAPKLGVTRERLERLLKQSGFFP